MRLKPGAALELLLPSGTWRADLAELDRNKAVARLVAPLTEDREASIEIQAWIPILAQLSLVDELLPPLVELGVAFIQPVIYARSEYDARKTAARLGRWRRIVSSACEQCHRSRITELRIPLPFEGLLSVGVPQKWVAYELHTRELNPVLRRCALAFTSGPEGGITEAEFKALCQADWKPVSLGPAILRAITAPVALLGGIQYQLGTLSDRTIRESSLKETQCRNPNLG
jgi:16S rRNA (uracil1498-N3)-methyltransferase